jgi:hypothetical protein
MRARISDNAAAEICKRRGSFVGNADRPEVVNLPGGLRVVVGATDFELTGAVSPPG